MKPKNTFHHIPLALIGIPILLLSPATHAQGRDRDVKPDEAKEVAETKHEKGNDRRAKAAAERARETAERAKEAEERAKEEATEKNDPKQDESDADEKPDTPARGPGRRETGPGDRERPERRPAPDRRNPADREPTERPTTPATPAIPAPPAVPATPADPTTPPTDDERKPPVDMPVVPSKPLNPGEEMKPRGDNSVPNEDANPERDRNDRPDRDRNDRPDRDRNERPDRDRDEGPDRDRDERPDRDRVEIPETEPERLAETEVTEVTRELHRDLDQRKTRIEGREGAQALIDEILGAESRISRAETAREERFRPRFERQRPGVERLPEATPDQRREATTYYQQRLLGREVEGPQPEFFRRYDRRGDRGDPRIGDRVVERVEYVRPRYLNEGRRYVHYDSRAAIPAILMAAQVMNQVRFQPTREIAPMFHERRNVSAPYAMPLPPENYRSEDSWVVSYPVDENSMISSEDILFLQGSTQFSDPYSYDVIAVMADAMKQMPEEERFVIEGHASAEGSYESNMVLSQQRAETIVREIVRRGVSPYRLLPVGYGESEARHPENAAEPLRSQDRRVVVFRMKPELVADR